MEEEKREVVVPGNGDMYGDKYYMTKSGRMIIRKNDKIRHKYSNEYGYTHVHLHKNGKRKLFKTIDIWRMTFPDLDENEYKGM